MASPQDYLSERCFRFRDRLILGGFLLAVLVPGTIGVSLYDRDEGWYAQTTREMVASGDWIIPRYLGASRYYKPPLMFWCSAVSVLAFGWSEFVLRLPGILATTATWLVVAEFTTRRWGRRAGTWAAVVAGTCIGPNLAGGLLLPEGYLLLFLTVAMLCWLHRLQTVSQPGHASSACGYGFWIAAALAFLAKGPAMFVVMVPCFWFFLLTEPARGSKFLDRIRRVWPGPGWYLWPLIALPWYVAVASLDWAAFKADFIGYHVMTRLRQPIEGHRGFPGYYIVTGLIFLWPWAALMPSALANAWSSRHDDAFVRRLGVWLVFPWLAFELISTKLPYYTLPLLPPLAMLTGRELARVTSAPSMRFRFEPMTFLVWLGGIALAGAALIVGAVVFRGQPPAPAIGAGGAVLLAIAIACALGRNTSAWRVRAGLVVVGMALFYQVLGWWAVPEAEPLRLSRRIAEHVNAIARADDLVLADGFAEPSMFFYLNRKGRELTIRDGRLDNVGASFILVAEERKLDLRRNVLTIDRAQGSYLEGFNYVRGRSVRVWIGRAVPIPASP